MSVNASCSQVQPAKKELSQFEVTTLLIKNWGKYKLGASSCKLLATLSTHLPCITISDTKLIEESGIPKATFYRARAELIKKAFITQEEITQQVKRIFINFETLDLQKTVSVKKQKPKSESLKMELPVLEMRQELSQNETAIYNRQDIDKKQTSSCGSKNTIDTKDKNDDVISKNEVTISPVTPPDTKNTDKKEPDKSKKRQFSAEEIQRYKAVMQKLESWSFTGGKPVIKKIGIDRLEMRIRVVEQTPGVNNNGKYLRSLINLPDSQFIPKEDRVVDKNIENLRKYLDNPASHLYNGQQASIQMEQYNYNSKLSDNELWRVLVLMNRFGFDNACKYPVINLVKQLKSDDKMKNRIEKMETDIRTIMKEYGSICNNDTLPENTPCSTDSSNKTGINDSGQEERSGYIPVWEICKTREEAIIELRNFKGMPMVLAHENNKRIMEKWGITIKDLQINEV